MTVATGSSHSTNGNGTSGTSTNRSKTVDDNNSLFAAFKSGVDFLTKQFPSESQAKKNPTTSVNRWICNRCYASFYTRESVRSHLHKEHHSLYQYECAICKYSHNFKSDVVTHLEREHKTSDSRKVISNFYNIWIAGQYESLYYLMIAIKKKSKNTHLQSNIHNAMHITSPFLGLTINWNFMN